MTIAPTALITGITGQDGSYLTELLLQKGYQVHGIIRRSSNFNTQRIDHLYSNPNLKLHYGDITDGTNLTKIINQVKPTEIYNLAAQSHVKVSFDQPEYTADTVAIGTLRLLEALKNYQDTTDLPIKMYQASSSEMYGSTPPPQNENTPFHPRSPYAVSKVAAYWYSRNYREAYNLHISNGILFNHEAPRRGETFVTRKITRAATRIKLGLQDKLQLGNLTAKRDWGYAPDYVQAMWMMLQQPTPDDYVIATGQSHTVQEFLEETFGNLEFNWQDHVQINPQYLRPTEVDNLQGDPTKANKQLGWYPQTNFKQLVQIMVQADLRLAKQELILKQNT
jgi:GDPmannose 4,6-dehydratase